MPWRAFIGFLCTGDSVTPRRSSGLNALAGIHWIPIYRLAGEEGYDDLYVSMPWRAFIGFLLCWCGRPVKDHYRLNALAGIHWIPI